MVRAGDFTPGKMTARIGAPMTLSALALLPLLLGAEAPPPDPLAQQIGRDFDAPPPGMSAKDQALWRSAYDVNNRILVERAAATRLQATLAGGRYEDRLEALARGGADGAARSEALQKELASAWTENADLLTRQWPVDPTRACRYPLLNLEGAVLAREPAERALDAARGDVAACVEKAQLPLGALARSNERLRALVARLDRELPPPVPVTAPAAADRPATPAGGDRPSGGGSR